MPHQSPVSTIIEFSMTTLLAFISMPLSILSPLITVPLPVTTRPSLSSYVQPGPLVSWPGTLVRFVPAGTPVLVVSGKPHRWETVFVMVSAGAGVQPEACVAPPPLDEVEGEVDVGVDGDVDVAVDEDVGEDGDEVDVGGDGDVDVHVHVDVGVDGDVGVVGDVDVGVVEGEVDVGVDGDWSDTDEDRCHRFPYWRDRVRDEYPWSPANGCGPGEVVGDVIVEPLRAPTTRRSCPTGWPDSRDAATTLATIRVVPTMADARLAILRVRCLRLEFVTLCMTLASDDGCLRLCVSSPQRGL